MAKYQTISEFLYMPFGMSASLAKLERYKALYLENTSKIILNAYTKIDESYYFHVKVPSASQKDANVYYDVVIRFFTNKADAKASSHLRDYFIQFFSNSPGFIYNYAVLYKNHGFLIDSLYTKMDPRYFDKLPIKTNKRLELSYDKTIYFACRFLNERKFKVLNKFSIPLGKKLSPDKFFNEIKDFQTIKIDSFMLNMERKAKNDLSKTFERSDLNGDKSNQESPNTSTKKGASLSTTQNDHTVKLTKKTSTNSTSTVKSITKKTASKSTRKK